MVAKYLQMTAHWEIRFKQSKPLPLTDKDYEQGFFRLTSYNIPDDPTLKEPFNVDINTSKLVGFVDAAHANDLRKQRCNTGVVFTFMGGAVVYKSKKQSLTASSSTEAEFIAAHAAKIACYLQMLLKQLGYEQKDPTPFYIDNLPSLRMINDNSSPPKRMRHINYRYLQIQDWRIYGDIIMLHIPGILNISDAETKTLGFVLHS